MVREEARRTLLREYDKWAQDHPRGHCVETDWLHLSQCAVTDLAESQKSECTSSEAREAEEDWGR
jgi:hypothetical protein